MTPRSQLLILLAVASVVFFLGLGRLPLTEPDEGRNAEVAREMLVQRDWITPHFDTLPYLDKPAAFFWLVAASFRIFGVSEWPARLPSALAALGTMLLVWFLARRMFGEDAGLRAGVIFASSALAFSFARLVIFDMTLTFFITLTMVMFWFAQAPGRRQRAWRAVMFAAAGLAAITKGPVGFLLPLLSILLYAALQRKLGTLKRTLWVPELALFFAASLPWFIAVSVRHPDFPRYAFWNESILRFTTGHVHRSGSVFYYIPVFLLGFLPWSLPLVLASVNRVRAWKKLRESGRAPQVFLLAWAVTIFVFFSFSHSKLPAYFLPAIPALAALMAKVWADDLSFGPERRAPDWLTASFALLIAIGLLLAAAPSWLRISSFEKVAERKIHPAVFQVLPPTVFYSGLILAALGFLGRNLATRSRGRLSTAGSFAVLAVAMPLVAARWWPALQVYAETSSTRRLANVIQRGTSRADPIYGYFYFRTSLPFYLRRPVGLVTADADELTSNYIISRWPELKESASRSVRPSNPGSPPLFLSGAGFTNLARFSQTPLLVLVRNNEADDITNVQAAVEPLWQAWQYSVWRISASNHAAPNIILVPANIDGAANPH